MTTYSFDAYVTAALFDRTGQALFALGDGTVRLQDGTAIEAHPGAGVLCAASHPSGAGIVTGGDDGRLAWTLPSGAKVLAEAPGRWIEAVAASAASGLIAFSAGKTARIVSANDPAFERAFEHETSVLGLAFDPKGLRVAVAAYGGVWNWYARIAQQKPQTLKWAGIHNDVLFSPDGKFLITALQDAQLHAWRLSDGKDMRMGGYPAKVKSMAFLSDGALVQASILGLEPDGMSGEAFLIPYWNTKAGGYECQMQPGYKGVVKLARNTGEIMQIDAQPIRLEIFRTRRFMRRQTRSDAQARQ